MRYSGVALLVMLLIVSPGVRAQKYAGEFMALGGGAKSMAMGGAFTAVADDATASFWNPAGLAVFLGGQDYSRDWQVIMMHSERFGDIIDYNFASAAFPIRAGESAWGLTLIHMGIDDIRIIPFTQDMIGNTDYDDRFEPWRGEYLKDFDYSRYPLESVNDFALFLSYAQVMEFGAVGASVKFIRNDQVTGVTSFGLGLDVGFLKRDLWRDLCFGAKLQDATGTYISWSTGEREFIYPALKLGFAYPLDLKSFNGKLVLAADGDFRYENRRAVSQFWIGRASMDFHIGAELILRDLVSLRGGLDMDRPTAGAGFLLKNFGPWNITMGLDYALLIHDVLDSTHRVSLLIAH